MSHSTARFHTFRAARPQTGAALVVGLILMLVLTVLGISGMGMATLELTMAGNADSQQEAFQAAETGIDIPLGRRDFTTSEIKLGEKTPIAEDGNYSAKWKTECVMTTPVPDIAFSMGTSSGSVQAFHFDIVSVGTGPRGATSTHTQSFYVIGPGGVGC